MIYKNEKSANFKLAFLNWDSISSVNKQLIKDNLEKGITVHYINDTFTLTLGDLSFECFNSETIEQEQNAFLSIETNILDNSDNIICAVRIQTIINNIVNTNTDVIPIMPSTNVYSVTTDSLNVTIINNDDDKNTINYSDFNEMAKNDKIIMPYNTDFYSNLLEVTDLVKTILKNYDGNNYEIYKQKSTNEPDKFVKLKDSEFIINENGEIKDYNNENFDTAIMLVLDYTKVRIPKNQSIITNDIFEDNDSNDDGFFHAQKQNYFLYLNNSSEDSYLTDVKIMAVDCCSSSVFTENDLPNDFTEEKLTLVNPVNFGKLNSPKRISLNNNYGINCVLHPEANVNILGINQFLPCGSYVSSNCFVETENKIIINYSFNSETHEFHPLWDDPNYRNVILYTIEKNATSGEKAKGQYPGQLTVRGLQNGAQYNGALVEESWGSELDVDIRIGNEIVWAGSVPLTEAYWDYSLPASVFANTYGSSNWGYDEQDFSAHKAGEYLEFEGEFVWVAAGSEYPFVQLSGGNADTKASGIVPETASQRILGVEAVNAGADGNDLQVKLYVVTAGENPELYIVVCNGETAIAASILQLYQTDFDDKNTQTITGSEINNKAEIGWLGHEATEYVTFSGSIVLPMFVDSDQPLIIRLAGGTGSNNS